MIRIVENFARWLAEQFTPAKAASEANAAHLELLEPSKDQLEALFKKLDAATAATTNAFGQRATVHAVSYREQNFILTNAHVTNNLERNSTAFHYKGRKYLPLFRGDQFAFAEHLALNPRGGVCKPKPELKIDTEQTDTSILKLVSPDMSRLMLYELSFGEDSAKRLATAFRQMPSISNPFHDGKVSVDELMKITKDFRLEPMVIDSVAMQSRTPKSYSLARFENRPQILHHTALPSSYNSTTFDIQFDCKNQIVRGHSGGPLADVTANGLPKLLGMITTTNIEDGHLSAGAVKLSQIIPGLDALIEGRLLNASDVTVACTQEQNRIHWLDARYVVSKTPPIDQNSGGLANARPIEKKRPSPCPAY